MTPIRLAEIKKRWELSKCPSCAANRTVMNLYAIPFVYTDAPELFTYIEELEVERAAWKAATTLLTAPDPKVTYGTDPRPKT